MEELTKNQRAVLRHTLGMDSDTPGHRNYFVAGKGHHDYDDLIQLEQMGLMAVRIEQYPAGTRSSLWRATPKGRELVGAPALHEKMGGGDDG